MFRRTWFFDFRRSREISVHLDRNKNVCTCHGIARRNWEIQGLFAIVLRLNYYFVAKFRQVFKDETVVFTKYVVPVTGRSIAKILSLTVLPTS